MEAKIEPSHHLTAHNALILDCQLAMALAGVFRVSLSPLKLKGLGCGGFKSVIVAIR